MYWGSIALQWRHNGHDCASNHQPHHCLLKRFFGRRSKKTSKLRVTGLCVGNSPGTGEFPAQMASNAENVSIWWRHHGAAYVIGRATHVNHNSRAATHYSDVTLSTMASQITGVSFVCSTVCSGSPNETSKPRVTCLCEGNSPVTCEFPTQKASNAENVSIWWRHHE